MCIVIVEYYCVGGVVELFYCCLVVELGEVGIFVVFGIRFCGNVCICWIGVVELLCDVIGDLLLVVGGGIMCVGGKDFVLFVRIVWL